jgi:hypothetical protein
MLSHPTFLTRDQRHSAETHVIEAMSQPKLGVGEPSLCTKQGLHDRCKSGPRQLSESEQNRLSHMSGPQVAPIQSDKSE